MENYLRRRSRPWNVSVLALRTGRWAGRLIQMQICRKSSVDLEENDKLFMMATRRFELLYENIPMFFRLIRLRAEDGYK